MLMSEPSAHIHVPFYPTLKPIPPRFRQVSPSSSPLCMVYIGSDHLGENSRANRVNFNTIKASLMDSRARRSSMLRRSILYIVNGHLVRHLEVALARRAHGTARPTRPSAWRPRGLVAGARPAACWSGRGGRHAIAVRR